MVNDNVCRIAQTQHFIILQVVGEIAKIFLIFEVLSKNASTFLFFQTMLFQIVYPAELIWRNHIIFSAHYSFAGVEYTVFKKT